MLLKRPNSLSNFYSNKLYAKIMFLNVFVLWWNISSSITPLLKKIFIIKLLRFISHLLLNSFKKSNIYSKMKRIKLLINNLMRWKREFNKSLRTQYCFLWMKKNLLLLKDSVTFWICSTRRESCYENLILFKLLNHLKQVNNKIIFQTRSSRSNNLTEKKYINDKMRWKTMFINHQK